MNNTVKELKSVLTWAKIFRAQIHVGIRQTECI